MKVLVCGGRKFDDLKGFWSTMDRLHAEYGFTTIIHGGATGADTLAGLWAAEKGIEVRDYPIDVLLDGTGDSAPIFRNMRMHDKEFPDLVIAFPGGAGTGHMISYARFCGTKALEVVL